MSASAMNDDVELHDLKRDQKAATVSFGAAVPMDYTGKATASSGGAAAAPAETYESLEEKAQQAVNAAKGKRVAMTKIDEDESWPSSYMCRQIQTVSMNAELEYLHTLHEFAVSYQAFKAGKNPNIHPSVLPATNESRKLDAKWTKENQADRTKADLVQKSLVDKYGKMVKTELMGYPISVPQVLPSDPMKRQEYKTDVDALTEAIARLSTSDKVQKEAEALKKRTDLVRIANLDTGSDVEYFEFEAGGALTATQTCAPHPGLEPWARQYRHWVAQKSVLKTLSPLTETQIPWQFFIVRRQPVGLELPRRIALPVRTVKHVSGKKIDDWNTMSMLGLSLCQSLIALLAYEIDLMHDTPSKDKDVRASQVHERQDVIKSESIKVGTILFEWGGDTCSAYQIAMMLMHEALRAWEIGGTIDTRYSKCVKCPPQVDRVTIRCPHCRNRPFYTNRMEHPQSDKPDDEEDEKSKATAATRTNVVANWRQLIIRVTARTCGFHQLTHPRYPEWKAFLLGLLVPQLIAFGSADAHYIGKYHRWSYQEIVDFLRLADKRSAGHAFRLELFYHAAIQIVHWDYLETPIIEVTSIASPPAGSGGLVAAAAAAASDTKSKSLTKQTKNNTTLIQFQETKKAIVGALNKHEENTKKNIRPLFKALFKNAPITEMTTDVVELVYQYLFMATSQRFVSIDDLMAEARSCNTIVHQISPPVMSRYRDTMPCFNPPEAPAMVKMLNSKLRHFNVKAIGRYGFEFVDEQVPGSGSAHNVGLKIRPLNPKHAMKAHAPFLERLGVSGEDLKQMGMTPIDAQASPSSSAAAAAAASAVPSATAIPMRMVDDDDKMS